MKKQFFISILILSAVAVFAQGFYFDIGLGIGNAKTEINGQDISDLFDSSVKEVGVDLGFKMGYGPISGTPLYIVGEISGIGHRFEDNYNYMQFNSYLIGPGIIIYPVSFIQLGASIGYSFVSNQTDLPIEKVGCIRLTRRQYRDLMVISELARQQRELYSRKSHSLAGRIVSIAKPHARPIARGKARGM